MKRGREDDAGGSKATSAAPDIIDDPLAGRAGPKLFVGSLAKSVQEKDVLNLFLPYGKIVDIAFFWHMHGPRRGEPKGYCFLTYARTEDATAAIKALDDVRVHGRAIAVRYQKDADEGGNDARSMMLKARKSLHQQRGGGGGGGRDKGGAGSGAAAAGVASVALPKRPKSASAAAAEGGGGGGGGREGREQELALEAKIRLLKAQIAAGSGGEGGSRGGGSGGGRGGGRRG